MSGSTGMHTEVHIPLADLRVIKIIRIFFFYEKMAGYGGSCLSSYSEG